MSANMTTLHRALCVGHIDCVKAYLVNNSHLTQEELNYALVIASTKGRRYMLEVVRDLLRAGADPLSPDNDGRSPIAHALCRRDVRCLETLLKFSTNDVTPRSSQRSMDDREMEETYAPVMVAIAKRSIRSLRLLTQYIDKFRWRYPSLAWIGEQSSYFSTEDWETLLIMTWKVKGHLDSFLIDSVIQRGDSNVLRRILDLRIPLVTSHGQPDTDHSWMSNAVVGQDNLDMLYVLLEYKNVYHIDINACTKGGPSILQVACGRCNNPDVINLLLHHGVDPDLVGVHSWATRMGSPLFRTVQAMAIKPNSMHVLVSLLKYNCQLNSACKLDISSSVYGTPLDLALLSCNLYGAHALVTAGAKRQITQGQNNHVFVDLVPIAVRCTAEERTSFVRQYIQSPGSLRVLCRQTIRYTLRKVTQSMIEGLPLPNSMISFLRCSDLDEMAEQFKCRMEIGTW